MSALVEFCAFADRATPPTSSDATTRRKAKFTRFTMTPVRILSDDFRPATWDFGCDFEVFRKDAGGVGDGLPVARPA